MLSCVENNCNTMRYCYQTFSLCYVPKHTQKSPNKTVATALATATGTYRMCIIHKTKQQKIQTTPMPFHHRYNHNLLNNRRYHRAGQNVKKRAGDCAIPHRVKILNPSIRMGILSAETWPILSFNTMPLKIDAPVIQECCPRVRKYSRTMIHFLS